MPITWLWIIAEREHAINFEFTIIGLCFIFILVIFNFSQKPKISQYLMKKVSTLNLGEHGNTFNEVQQCWYRTYKNEKGNSLFFLLPSIFVSLYFSMKCVVFELFTKNQLRFPKLWRKTIENKLFFTRKSIYSSINTRS